MTRGGEIDPYPSLGKIQPYEFHKVKLAKEGLGEQNYPSPPS